MLFITGSRVYMYQVGRCFPDSRKVQRLCCLLVAELGATCGAPARRCLAECCEQVVVAAASDLDERSTCDGSKASISVRGGPGIRRDASVLSEGSPSCAPVEGVREAACQALAILAQESGLTQRLAMAGAGRAVTFAMQADARNRELQISCLETIERLATTASNVPSTWSKVSC